MDLFFTTRKLEKLCASEKAMRGEWGAHVARKLAARLMELQAADCLSDISRVPPARCHELTGDLAGLLSVTVSPNLRLLFRPEDPSPKKDDDGLDWDEVKQIVIVSVIDPH